MESWYSPVSCRTTEKLILIAQRIKFTGLDLQFIGHFPLAKAAQTLEMFPKHICASWDWNKFNVHLSPLKILNVQLSQMSPYRYFFSFIRVVRSPVHVWGQLMSRVVLHVPFCLPTPLLQAILPWWTREASSPPWTADACRGGPAQPHSVSMLPFARERADATNMEAKGGKNERVACH